MKNILEQQNDKQEWSRNIKNYENRKKNIEFKKIERPELVTKSKVLQNDTYFNPILQKYNNINLDSKIIQKEKNEMMNKIIKSRDNQLKNEQVYNIINLHDNLKGFENHPNYPKEEDIAKTNKKRLYRQKYYTNLPFYKENSEYRIPLTYKSQSKSQKKMSYLTYNKDYDIISTRYKHYNDEKNKIDKEMNKFNTAKIFYKNNDYNPIKGVYYNDEKEEEFQKKRYETMLTWGQEQIKKLPKCAKGKSNVYNLITTDIVDPVEMNRLIKEEKDKKQRYEIRYKLEKYYRDRSLSKNSLDEVRNKNKVSFQRYKVEDQRQYNIINFKDKPYKEHAKDIKGYQTVWETILVGGNDNNTFNKKDIYRDPYDYSETGKIFDDFKIRRTKTLSNLQKIEDDVLFNAMKKTNSKYKLKKSITNKQYNNEINKTTKVFIDKSKFFEKKE